MKLSTAAVCLAISLVFTTCSFDGGLEPMGKPPITVNGTDIGATPSLKDKLDWLDREAESGTTYILEVTSNSGNVISKKLYYSGKKVTIRITGGGIIHIGSFYDEPIFEVGSGVTLVLDNISLSSIFMAFPPDDGGVPFVKVSAGGVLVMNEGAKIFGNINNNDYGSDSMGGGVLVEKGTFIMNGGEIDGNYAKFGGGVYVDNGVFTMNGGTIHSNDSAQGGAVYVIEGGIFTINGEAVIRKNSASESGGGIQVLNSIFYKNGGIIYGDNAADEYKNTADPDKDYSGHAILTSRGAGGMPPTEKYRNNTIERNETISFNGTVFPGVWIGLWDSLYP